MKFKDYLTEATQPPTDSGIKLINYWVKKYKAKKLMSRPDSSNKFSDTRRVKVDFPSSATVKKVIKELDKTSGFKIKEWVSPWGDGKILGMEGQSIGAPRIEFPKDSKTVTIFVSKKAVPIPRGLGGDMAD